MKTPTITRFGRHLAAIAALLGVLTFLLLFGPGTGPVSAQEDGGLEEDVTDWNAPGVTPELDSEQEIGQGTCSPAVLASFQVTTCRFPLIGATELPTWSPLYAELIGKDEFDASGISDRCFIQGTELVCEDLPASFFLGEYEVGIDGLTFGESRATITVDQQFDEVLEMLIVSNGTLPAFADVVTSIDVFRSFNQAFDVQLDVVLRREGNDEIVERVPAVQVWESEGRIEITIPEPGRWTLAGCKALVGDVNGEEPCSAEGRSYTIEAIPSSPLPLIENHNDADAERIDLVFVGTGFDSADGRTVAEEAVRLLSLSGDPEVLGSGRVVWALGYGPFAIEPMRSNVGRFNFWYLDGQVDVHEVPYDPFFTTPMLDPASLGLGNDAVLILLDRKPGRATASLPSFADSGVIGDIAEHRLGSVHLPVPIGSYVDHEVLSHELGHAIFGLRDEYVETEYENPAALTGYPNCVETRAEAEAAWGDQVGELDPMFIRWVAQLTSVQLRDSFPQAVRANFEVGYVAGGCYGPDEAEGVVRPTVDSLMNSSAPVFGAVNRARVQQILDLYPTPAPTPTPTATPAPTPTVLPTATPVPTATLVPVTATATASPAGAVGGDAEAALPATGAGEESSGALPALVIAGVLVGVAALALLALGLRRRRNESVT